MFWRNSTKKNRKKKTTEKLSLKPKSFSSVHLFSRWKEGIYVSLGKCFLSSLLPTHGCDLWEHSFFFPTRNMSSGTFSVCSLCPCACFPCRCVCVRSVLCPEVERAPVQLSGSDHDLTLPTLFLSNAPPVTLWSCTSQWRACLPACLPACLACACVSARVHVSHMWPPWRQPEL